MLNWYSLDEKIKLNKWVYLKRAQKAKLCIINNWMIKMQHLIPDGRFHDANCGGNNRKLYSSRRLQHLMLLQKLFPALNWSALNLMCAALKFVHAANSKISLDVASEWSIKPEIKVNELKIIPPRPMKSEFSPRSQLNHSREGSKELLFALLCLAGKTENKTKRTIKQ